MSKSKRRKYPRINATFGVLATTELGQSFQAESVNLSLGGALICFFAPSFGTGDVLSIEIIHLLKGGSIRLTCRVAHCNVADVPPQKIYMGLMFVTSTKAIQDQLQSMLGEL